MYKVCKILFGLFLCAIFLTACFGSGSEDKSGTYTLEGVDYEFGQLTFTDSSDAPGAPGFVGLKIEYDLAYVVEDGANADIAKRMNNEIVKYEFGTQFDGMSIYETVDSVFSEIKCSYQFSCKNVLVDSSQTSCPAVFHEYRKESKFMKGQGGVVCYVCNDYISNDSTDGEHGYWALNFDGRSGEVMHYADVFDPMKDAHVRQLVQRQLMADLNLEHNLSLETPQDLKYYGYAFNENLLPATHVFMLGEEGVTFIYEVYSIAPFNMGSTLVTVSYEDIKYCLTEKACKILFG